MQRGQGRLHGEDHALPVHRQEVIQQGFGDLAEPAERANPGIAEHHVQMTRICADACIMRVELFEVVAIALNRSDGAGHVRHRCGRDVFATPGDEAASPLGREPGGGRPDRCPCRLR